MNDAQEPALLPYERRGRRMVRRLRRALATSIIVLLAAAWPVSQTMNQRDYLIIDWIWGRRAFKMYVAVTWNRTAIGVASTLSCVTWDPGEPIYRATIMEDRGQKLYLFSRHYHEWGNATAEPVGSLVRITSHPKEAGIELQELGWRVGACLPIGMRHPSGLNGTNRTGGLSLAIPSWAVALLSILGTILLGRKIRRWRASASSTEFSWRAA